MSCDMALRQATRSIPIAKRLTTFLCRYCSITCDNWGGVTLSLSHNPSIEFRPPTTPSNISIASSGCVVCSKAISLPTCTNKCYSERDICLYIATLVQSEATYRCAFRAANRVGYDSVCIEQTDTALRHDCQRRVISSAS